MAHVVDNTYGRNRDLGQVTDPALLAYYAGIGYTIDGTVTGTTPGPPAQTVFGLVVPYGATDGEVVTVAGGGFITAPPTGGGGGGSVTKAAVIATGLAAIDIAAAPSLPENGTTLSASGNLTVGKVTPINSTSGAVVGTLPAGTADGQTLGVRFKTGSNPASVTGTISGATNTIVMIPGELLVFRWDAGTTSWWSQAGNKPLTALDARFAPAGNYVALPSNVLTKTSAYTAAANDFIKTDGTTTGFTVTLPTSPAVGSAVAVQKTDTSAAVITVAPAGGGTINGDPNATIVARWAGAILEHLGSNAWAVVSVFSTSGPAGPTGPPGPAGAAGVMAYQSAGVIGSWYCSDPVPGNGTFTQNVALGTLILGAATIAPEDMTIDQLGCFVQTAGGAGALVRLGIYVPSAANPYRLALSSAYATLLVDGGTATATSSATRATLALGTPQVVTKGTAFCVGVAVQGAGPVGVLCPSNSSAAHGPFGTVSDLIFNGARQGASMTGVTGALPSTFTPSAYAAGGVGGGGWYRRSA